MQKVIVNTSKAPAPVGPYSQAIDTGSFLFCSGQVSIDPSTNEVLKGSVVEQTALVMKNIGGVLSQA
ncbi:MAG: reactive intermediate/imine deaminase, partial [Bdellovibrionales bacterium]|nr:reactive intermediate/imine deaminase [Bdellovibrionales bacterium]